MTEATILCIDDDVAALSGLVQRFEAVSYNVLRASDIDHGYLMFVENNPDLVTLEVGLNRGRGWELLERLVSAGARVLVISSQGLEQDVVRGLEAGAVDYVTKPYRSDEVLARARLRLQQSLPQESLLERAEARPAGSGQAEPEAEADQVHEPPAETIPSYGQPPALAGVPKPQLVAHPIDQPAAEAEPGESEPRSIGARLQVARRTRNISLVQAELETRIRMYYIQALEEERYALLPRGAATERIIRDYARFLGVDPQEAVGEYRLLYRNAEEPHHDLGNGSEIERTSSGRRIVLALLAALLALMLTAGALWYFVPNDMLALWKNVQDLLSF